MSAFTSTEEIIIFRDTFVSYVLPDWPFSPRNTTGSVAPLLQLH